MYMDKIVQNLTYSLLFVIHKHLELFIFLKMIKESGNPLPNDQLVMGVFLHIMKKNPHIKSAVLKKLVVQGIHGYDNYTSCTLCTHFILKLFRKIQEFSSGINFRIIK